MKKLILSLVTIVTLTFGATLKDADIAIKKKDYATAIKISEPLANKGDFEAQGFIAMLYSSLPGDKNIEKAIYWLEIVTERVENNGIEDNDFGYQLNISNISYGNTNILSLYPDHLTCQITAL